MKQSIMRKGMFFCGSKKGILGILTDKGSVCVHDDRGTSGGGSRMSVCRRVSAQSLYSGGVSETSGNISEKRRL